MLLLGRGSFSSKGKSLIKLTKTRIDVIKRKRGATQKFLKKDIADLLANGLDQNAFGRAEGLISELILSSCYDFIYHVCDIILKHLSAMQKQRDCPEDCKEAVASLMFAAARFSDLPELRDLRDIFQGRYGTSFEHKVNQKFVEHISAPNPPTKEQKMQLLQDVASEFTLRWDSLGFERRMANPAAREGHDQPKAHAPLYRNPTDHLAPQVDEPKDNINRLANKMEVNPQMKLREALYEVEHHNKPTGSTGSSRVQYEMNQNFRNGQEIRPNRQRSSPETENMREKHDVSHMRREYLVDPYSANPESAHPKRQEPISKEKLGDRVDVDTRRGAHERTQHILSPREVKLSPQKGRNLADSGRYDDNYEENVMIPPRKLPGKDTVGLKTEYKSSLLPPPYVKPKSRKDRVKQHELHSNGENNGTATYDRSRSRQRYNAPAGNGETVPQDVTDLYYEDDVLDDPTPRRKSRSRSRRHVRSCSSSDNGEEVRVVRRVSTTRRRNESSKQGLQIVFDEDHCDGHSHRRGNNPVDEEEKMIEKLLMHYSKKDKSAGVSGGEIESRRRSKDEVSVNGCSKSSRSRTPVYVSDDEDEELHLQQKHPARSISLPKEQIVRASSSETKKVFTRAVSFDQGPSTPAKHVHPKLPDYDDLAARFAALRRS